MLIHEERLLISGVLRGAELSIAMLTGREVTLVEMPKQPDMPGEVQEMLGVIALALEMTMDDYFEVNRKRAYVDLRCMAALFINRYYSYISLGKTGGLVGGLDHTSIINYRTRARNMMQTGEVVFMRKYLIVLKAVELWMQG